MDNCFTLLVMKCDHSYMQMQIRETPHKRHHKFIEFYDVRAAEAALRALNRSDIAGKRIKLEPSRPGGARRKYALLCLTLCLSLLGIQISRILVFY